MASASGSSAAKNIGVKSLSVRDSFSAVDATVTGSLDLSTTVFTATSGTQAVTVDRFGPMIHAVFPGQADLGAGVTRTYTVTFPSNLDTAGYGAALVTINTTDVIRVVHTVSIGASPNVAIQVSNVTASGTGAYAIEFAIMLV